MLKFIIIVVLFFIGKFIFDSLNQSKEMKILGGIRKKYSKLVQTLLEADPRAKVIQETDTFMNIGVSGPAGAQSFLLQQTFGYLTIQIVVKNNPLLGDMKIERSFPEGMDQELMMAELMETQQKEVMSKINRYI